MSGQEGTEEVRCTVEGEDLREGDPLWLKERGWHLSWGVAVGVGQCWREAESPHPPTQRPLSAEPGAEPTEPPAPRRVWRRGGGCPQHHRAGQRKMGL